MESDVQSDQNQKKTIWDSIHLNSRLTNSI